MDIKTLQLFGIDPIEFRKVLLSIITPTDKTLIRMNELGITYNFN